MVDRADQDHDLGPPRRPADPAGGQGEVLAIVRFKDQRKDYYHNHRGHALQVGQYCLVEADRGRDLGQILYLGPGRPLWWQQAQQQGILGLATAPDLARIGELRREEREDREIARRRIEAHGLPMQLVGVERRWDRKKVTFYFLAEGRVDFRALVRDLAGIFRARIELRQIGVRDEARLKGGLGVCGRTFCCATFLGSFNSVGLRMAKDQQLALNQAKLSGPCGRLRCCLAFEHATYQEALAEMPRLGGHVRWQERPARVRKLDPLQGRVTILLADNGQDVVEVPADELEFTRSEPEPAPATEAGASGRGRRRRGRPRDGHHEPGQDADDR